jgi:hypothetical protein
MGGRGGSGRSSAAVIQVPAVDSRALADMDIADAYEDVLNIKGLSGNPWVTLLQLRTALSVRGMDRERQDRELTRFANERKGILVPEENQKTLTPVVRNAGLTYGGEVQHLFRIER